MSVARCKVAFDRVLPCAPSLKWRIGLIVNTMRNSGLCRFNRAMSGRQRSVISYTDSRRRWNSRAGTLWQLPTMPEYCDDAEAMWVKTHAVPNVIMSMSAHMISLCRVANAECHRVRAVSASACANLVDNSQLRYNASCRNSRSPDHSPSRAVVTASAIEAGL